MGINNAHSLTYSLWNLKLGQLVAIANAQLRDRQNQSATFKRVSPTINIDCSWVARRLLSGNLKKHVGYVCRVALCLAQCGLCITLVCDGEKQHDSKRATIKRSADTQQKRLEMILKKVSC
jgi:hypothetical protein